MFSDQKLFDQVLCAAPEFQCIVELRKNECFVEAKRIFHRRTTRQQLGGAFEKFAQHLAGILHDLDRIGRRVPVIGSNPEATRESVDQFFTGEVTQDLRRWRRRSRLRRLSAIRRIGNAALLDVQGIGQGRIEVRLVIGRDLVSVGMDRDEDFEVAETQAVPAEQATQIAFAQRLAIAVDKNAV